MPYSTIPAIKIARLAVATNNQGEGLGHEAIQFAVYISQIVKTYSGVVFLTLDCYEHRLGFYEKIGFKRILLQPIIRDYDSPISMRLWIDNFINKPENNNG